MSTDARNKLFCLSARDKTLQIELFVCLHSQRKGMGIKTQTLLNHQI